MSRAASLAPRGLSREQAASYVGVGATLFDRMVLDGRMPKCKPMDGRRVWDRKQLDDALEALPNAGAKASPNVDWTDVAV
jgi:predicted DNA-binding transcriptional regulator AlpA